MTKKSASLGPCCAPLPNTGYRGYGYGRPTLCGKNAKVEREGHFYCGIHDPVRVKAKHDERAALWHARFDKKAAEHRKNESLAAARTALIEAARKAFRQQGTWDAVADAVASLEAIERE